MGIITQSPALPPAGQRSRLPALMGAGRRRFETRAEHSAGEAAGQNAVRYLMKLFVRRVLLAASKVKVDLVISVTVIV
ncbi:MAG: hypothetical protein HY784_03975 [Chloroflexi bacterium]|nr:hypothetical protein [Chloroflexota bacterium]